MFEQQFDILLSQIGLGNFSGNVDYEKVSDTVLKVSFSSDFYSLVLPVIDMNSYFYNSLIYQDLFTKKYRFRLPIDNQYYRVNFTISNTDSLDLVLEIVAREEVNLDGSLDLRGVFDE